jgi:cbb3-type cytochrome oxidase subunit 3
MISAFDIQSFGVIATVFFVAIFVTILIRALTQPRAEVDRHARLPLDDGDQPNPGSSS